MGARPRWTSADAPDSLSISLLTERGTPMSARKLAGIFASMWLLTLVAGCSPKVQVEAPKEPIVINMNVKIEHEIRIKVDKDLDDMFENEELF
jgi:hypothetical protein